MNHSILKRFGFLAVFLVCGTLMAQEPTPTVTGTITPVPPKSSKRTTKTPLPTVSVTPSSTVVPGTTGTKHRKGKKKAAETPTPVTETRVVPTPKPTAATPKVHLEIAGEMSLTNNYAMGNLNDWYTQLAGSGGEVIGDTAPGFDQIDLRLMFGDVGQDFRMGIGLSYYIGSTHAFNDISGAYGTVYQFAATPAIMMMSIPIQIQLGHGSDFYWALEPAMGLGFFSDGYLDYGASSSTLLDPGFQVGYQMGTGLDAYMGGLLIFTRMGYRFQKVPVEFDDPKSGNTKQYLLSSNGDGVAADMSGLYWTLGLGFSL